MFKLLQNILQFIVLSPVSEMWGASHLRQAAPHRVHSPANVAHRGSQLLTTQQAMFRQSHANDSFPELSFGFFSEDTSSDLEEISSSSDALVARGLELM